MKKGFVFIVFLLFVGCVSHKFNVEEYRQKLLNIRFDDKDMYFVGDSFKVGDSLLTVVNIYTHNRDKYGRVELTIKSKNGFKKVFLDKFDYYIVDPMHAVVVLDVDTTSPADKNVTIGICNPRKLPVKLDRIQLASSSLSPKEFLIRLNGKIVKLNMDAPLKSKKVLIKLTAVSTSSNALERTGALVIDVIMKEGEKIIVGGKELQVDKIVWDKLPSQRRIILRKGLEAFTLGKGGSQKIDKRVIIKASKILNGCVELIFKIKNVQLGENFVLPLKL